MSKKSLLTTLMLVFMVTSLMWLLLFNASKPHLMLVYSGAADVWVNQQFERGVQEALANNRQPLVIDRYYLDLAQAAGSPNRKRQAQLQFDQLLAQRRPDLVALVDDEANSVLGTIVMARSNLKLLYASINEEPQDHGYGNSPRITGHREELPLTAVSEVLGLIFPGRALRVAYLGSDGASGRAALEHVRQYNWSPHRMVHAQVVKTDEQWKRAVQALAGQADVILVGNLSALAQAAVPPQVAQADATGSSGRLVSTAADVGAAVAADLPALVKWTDAQSSALPIGLTGTFTVHGGSLALAPPRDEEGHDTLQMALAWMDPRGQGAAPPPMSSAHFQVHIRQQALQRRGLVMPNVLLESARAAGTLDR